MNRHEYRKLKAKPKRKTRNKVLTDAQKAEKSAQQAHNTRTIKLGKELVPGGICQTWKGSMNDGQI